MLSAEHAYLFRHALLRDDGTRRPDEGQECEPYADEIAGHARDAGDLVPESAEATWLYFAAVHAARTFRNADAVRLWQRVASRARGGHRAAAFLFAGKVASLQGRYEEAEALPTEAIRASEVDAPEWFAPAFHMNRGICRRELGRLAEAEADLRLSCAGLERLGLRAQAARARTALSSALAAMGRREEALRELKVAREALRTERDEQAESEALHLMATQARLDGRREEAERMSREALELAVAARDPWGECRIRGTLAVMEAEAGRAESSERLYRENLARAREAWRAGAEKLRAGGTAADLDGQVRRMREVCEGLGVSPLDSAEAPAS